MASSTKEIARGVFHLPLSVVNAYFVGDKGNWFLVDSGFPGKAPLIKKAAEARFGAGAHPTAIILTHGHPDHVGSAQALAEQWNVQVFAHPAEMPFLSGRAQYPPLDPTAPGFLATISRFFPPVDVNLGSRLTAMDEFNPFPGLPGWKAIHTPGHSPGHIAFFRESDGVLLAGDAITTVNTESLLSILRKKKEVCRPATPATTDWPQARASVIKLAALRPGLLAAGHGVPMLNSKSQLQQLADHFTFPSHGRYVTEPVRVDEKGLTVLPPAPVDQAPGIAASVVVAGLAVGVGALYSKFGKYVPKPKRIA